MANSDYERVEKAIAYIDANFRLQPSLAQIAGHVGLSEYHFHRLFQRWAGITPKRFLHYLTAEYAGDLLRRSRSILEVTYSSGLSSAGRLHDLFIRLHAATPGEVKNLGQGVRIAYAVHETLFGPCFIALFPRGVIALEFTCTNQ